MDATRSPKDLVELGVKDNGQGKGGRGGQKSWTDNTSTSTSTRRRTGNTNNNKNDIEAPAKLRSDGREKRQRHFRTFFLAFHHFDEDMAVRVLKDAMEGGDGIG